MKIFFSLFIISALLATALSSCSLIGYGLGSLLDNGPAHDTVAIFKDISDYTGQVAKIRFNDSSVRYAIFKKYSDEPADQYRDSYERYAESHSSDPAAIRLGDSIVLMGDRYWSKRIAAFEGFFPEGILLRGEKLYFGDFDSIIFPNKIARADIKKRFEANAIPIRGTLHFESNSGGFKITNRDCQNIIIMPHTAPWRWIFLGIGAAIDIAGSIVGGFHSR